MSFPLVIPPSKIDWLDAQSRTSTTSLSTNLTFNFMAEYLLPAYDVGLGILTCMS